MGKIPLWFQGMSMTEKNIIPNFGRRARDRLDSLLLLAEGQKGRWGRGESKQARLPACHL